MVMPSGSGGMPGVDFDEALKAVGTAGDEHARERFWVACATALCRHPDGWSSGVIVRHADELLAAYTERMLRQGEKVKKTFGVDAPPGA